MIKKVLVCLFAIAAVTSTGSVDAQAAKPKPKASSTGKTDLVVGGIQLAAAVIPLIGGLFKKKQCRQVACWVSTPSCFRDAAAKVQNEIFQGRDGYSIESSGPTGAWVRYWRVRTGVSKDQVIASGKCEDGKKFEVFNCQQTQGKVHC